MKGFIKKIKQINFGLMSPEDIREMSVVKIETPDTYDEDGYPIENGLNPVLVDNSEKKKKRVCLNNRP